MKIQGSPSAKGQVLVFIVLAVGVLIGFVALALDGGSIYNARRTAQNAADASALAAASDIVARVKTETNKNWNCSSLAAKNGSWNKAILAAVTQATTNEFTIASDMSSNNGVEIVCDNTNKHIDVRVLITHEPQVYFMDILGLSQPVDTVEAVVRITPKIVFAEGAAIVASKDNCDQVPGQSDGGITFDGTVNLIINDGGIVSNNCCGVNGNSNQVTINKGNWTCAGEIDLNPHPPYPDPGEPTPTPDPTLPTPVPPKLNPPPVNGPPIGIDVTSVNNQLSAACGAAPDSHPSNSLMVTKKGDVIVPSGSAPVKYNDVSVKQGATLELKPGLYCFYGSVGINGTLTGSGVTIYMPSTAGSFDVSADATVILSAPPVGCEYDENSCRPRIGGLLILYMPDDVGTGQTSYFKMSGNTYSNYSGTIMVPNTAVIISGNSTLGGCNSAQNRVQIVAETVKINGSGDICINYDTNYVYTQPGFLNLNK